MLSSGLEGVSVQIRRVADVMARSTAERSCMLTRVCFESPVGHDSAQKNGRTVISVLGGNDVVSGRERLKYRKRSGAAGRKCERGCAFFQRGERVLQRFTIRIVRPAIKISAGKRAIVGLVECGGEMDGGHNVA